MPDFVEEDGKTATPVADNRIDEASENERQIRFHACEAKRYMVLAKQATQKISESEQTSLKYAICAGTHLLAAKKLLPHGRWEKWVKANYGTSARTARLYMQIAKHYGPPGKIAVDDMQSIQAALNAIVRHKQDLGPREVIGLNEWMQYAKQAKNQLGQSVKDTFINSIEDDVAVFLWTGPGKAVWDDILKEAMISFVKELRSQIGNSYEGWHAKLIEERAVERVEHCHRMIEECENRKDVLSEEIAGEDANKGECENSNAVRLEGQAKSVEKTLGQWKDMLVEAKRDLEGQRKRAREATKQKMGAEDQAPAVVSIANSRPREHL